MFVFLAAVDRLFRLSHQGVVAYSNAKWRTCQIDCGIVCILYIRYDRSVTVRIKKERISL
jgi:hypothetical protein